MKRMIAIALALGTVSPALAQSDTGLIFEAPAVLSPAQPSITVELWAEFGRGDYAFAVAEFDVIATEPGWSDPVGWLGWPGATPGTVAGTRVLGALVGQRTTPAGLFADPTNPIWIWSAQYTITDFTPRTITLTTDTSLFHVYPERESLRTEPRPSHEALHEIRVIPAPGALGLLGLTGILALGRRRRAARASWGAGALVAGALAGAASAQSDTGLLFDAPDVLSPAQPSITVHLWAQFPAADYAFTGARFDVLATEPGWSDPVDILRTGGTKPGTIVGTDVIGVIVGQYHSPTAWIFADPTNPIDVWKALFTITDFTPRTITIATETKQFVVYPEKESSTIDTRPSHEAFHAIRVIPAPGALGLGGLVGLCVLRRRPSRRPR